MQGYDFLFTVGQKKRRLLVPMHQEVNGIKKERNEFCQEFIECFSSIDARGRISELGGYKCKGG